MKRTSAIETHDRFGIPLDYVVNDAMATRETVPGAYWTDERIETSAVYQYHVYEFAAACMRNRPLTKLLDIGSGPGTKIKMLFDLSKTEVTCIDQPTAEAPLRRTLPNVSFFPADLECPDVNLPHAYDVVVCADVLEHLQDPDNCLDLIKQAISGGGLAILSTPERDALRGVRCNGSPKLEHVREWRKSEFANYLHSQGLTILRHFCVPSERVANWKARLCAATSYYFRRRYWHDCQIAVCKLASIE